jgi:hypothetical protein
MRPKAVVGAGDGEGWSSPKATWTPECSRSARLIKDFQSRRFSYRQPDGDVAGHRRERRGDRLILWMPS